MLEETLTINFSEQGDCDTFIISGWWEQEKERRWTKEKANFYFIPTEKANISLKICGEVAVNYKANVLINRETLWSGDWKKEETFKTFEIPENLIQENIPIIITLEFEDAVSPKDLGRSEDSRKLGLFVESIEITYK